MSAEWTDPLSRLTRRGFFGVGLTALAALPGCDIGPQEPERGSARLRVRPAAPGSTVQPGDHELLLSNGKEGVLHVPPGYAPETPAPLVVLLHGAGGAAPGMEGFFPLADERDVLVLAPSSTGSSWDLMSQGRFGPDVRMLDTVLEEVFDRCAVDATRLAIGGFSDGASYGLSVGLTNGDLFTHLLAFSPGYMAPTGRRGEPDIFVSHGTQDQVLPIDQTSRQIVPQLRDWGYEVDYREFTGGHVVPVDLARTAFLRLAGEAETPGPA